MSDRGNSVRLISFDPALRSSLATSSEEGTMICINNCQIKPDKDGGNEITLTTKTKIDQSPRKHPVQATDLSKITQVDAFPHLANGQQVNVKVKVVRLGQSVEVNNRKGVTLQKQDCVIADVSGSKRLVLWENDVSKLAVDKCYDLRNSCGLDERRGAVLVYVYEPLMKYTDLYFANAEISSLVLFLC